jgi:hypothetical protein
MKLNDLPRKTKKHIKSILVLIEDAHYNDECRTRLSIISFNGENRIRRSYKGFYSYMDAKKLKENYYKRNPHQLKKLTKYLKNKDL